MLIFSSALITFVVPEGVSGSLKMLILPRDITFENFKAAVYDTFGCTDVKLKPTLMFKIGLRSLVLSLADNNDFLQLINSKELSSKKGADVKVIISIPKDVHRVYPLTYYTS